MKKLIVSGMRLGFQESVGAPSFPQSEIVYKHLLEGKKESETLASSIKIHKSAQKISYMVTVNQGDLEVDAHFREAVLSKEEVDQIFSLGYLLKNEHLFFFNKTIRSEAGRLLNSVNLKEKIKFLSSIPSGSMVEGEQTNLAERFSRFNPKAQFKASEVLKVPLYPYQERGLNWLLHCYAHGVGAILGDDMGLGKTAQIIATIAYLRASGSLKNSVIVVPNTLIDNWVKEFDIFAVDLLPYVHSGPLRGGLSDRLQEKTVVLVPYSIVVNDISMLEELDIDMLVFDEASLLKNPDSQRYLSASQLNSFVTVAVTGTPIENSLKDIWAVSNIVSTDYLGERTIFESKYCSSPLSDILNQELEGIESQLSNIMLRRMKKDVLDDLPEKIDIHTAITMNDVERLSYNNLCEEILESQQGRTSAFALIGNLRKLTTHPVLLDTSILPTFQGLCNSSSKFLRLSELLREVTLRSEKVIIFANHIRMLDIFVEVLGEQFDCPVFKIDGTVDVGDRQATIDTFSEVSGSSILCLNPTVAAMGLNITAANHVVHYSRQWNPALEVQATARAFRNGQTKKVNAYYLYYAGTIEETIDERLRQKSELSDRVVQAVEHIQNENEFYLSEIKKMMRE